MPLIVALRGASTHHRESSPEAFDAAIDLGADAIETDIRRTKDGIFVCHHDETLQRTAGIDRQVAELSFAELRHLAPDYAVQLTDVLATLHGRINLLLDLKLRNDTDIAALIGLLTVAQVDGSVAIGVRTLATARLIRRRFPAFTQLGLLEDPDDSAEFIATGGDWVRLWQRDAARSRIEAVHALGKPVLVMVGGTGTNRAVGEVDAAGLAALRQLGADGFMLNDPSLAAAIR